MKNIAIILLVSLFMVGCSGGPGGLMTDDVKRDPLTVIQVEKTEIDKDITSVKNSIDDIEAPETEANKLHRAKATEGLVSIKKRTEAIVDSSITIDSARVENAEQAEKLQEKLDDNTNKYLPILYVVLYGLGGLLIVGAVGLGFMGSLRMALAMGGAGVVLIGITSALIAYAQWLALGGLVLLLAGMGYLLYRAFVNRKALTETVGGVTTLIDKQSDEGKQVIKAELKNKQSKTVRKEIDKIRGE